MQQQQQQQRSQQPPMHHDEHVYTHAHQPTHPASVRTIAPPQGQGWNLKLLRQFLDHPAWHHTSRAGKGQIMGRGGEQQGDAHVGTWEPLRTRTANICQQDAHLPHLNFSQGPRYPTRQRSGRQRGRKVGRGAWRRRAGAWLIAQPHRQHATSG